MPQNPERLAHNEEAHAQALASSGIEAGESFKDLRNFLARDSSAGVVNINSNTRAGVPAANKYAATRLSVFDRIADQIAQRGAEEQIFAQYRRIA